MSVFGIDLNESIVLIEFFYIIISCFCIKLLIYHLDFPMFLFRSFNFILKKMILYIFQIYMFHTIYTFIWKYLSYQRIVWSYHINFNIIGEWKENKAQGKGKFWHVDGNIFEGKIQEKFKIISFFFFQLISPGEWKDDKANGYGVYIHITGAKYEGSWKDDQQDGYGVETWGDGSKYEGYYKEGKKHGEGTYTWNDGSKYIGNWHENSISGHGVYPWLDGRKYDGDWLNNNMHGKGIYTWKDGRRYEGEYSYDKKHGFGIYIWADGRRYEGNWAYGKQNGKGKYILPDGTLKIGIWEDGKRIIWLEWSSVLKNPYPKLSCDLLFFLESCNCLVKKFTKSFRIRKNILFIFPYKSTIFSFRNNFSLKKGLQFRLGTTEVNYFCISLNLHFHLIF